MFRALGEAGAFAGLGRSEFGMPVHKEASGAFFSSAASSLNFLFRSALSLSTSFWDRSIDRGARRGCVFRVMSSEVLRVGFCVGFVCDRLVL